MSELNCPRCKLPLRNVDYEGVEVDVCDACWGFWLDTGELEEILANRTFEFSDEEREQILNLRDASSTGTQEPAPCPKCGTEMARAHYDESVHVVIDQCSSHGVWLDTGEIKKVQALAEKSAGVHRMLVRKLNLKTSR